jgi:hypothetical protein
LNGLTLFLATGKVIHQLRPKSSSLLRGYKSVFFEIRLTQGGKYNDLLIYRFPRHDASVGDSYRQIIPAFQIFMLQKAQVGGTEKEIKEIEYPDLPEWFSHF